MYVYILLRCRALLLKPLDLFLILKYNTKLDIHDVIQDTFCPVYSWKNFLVKLLVNSFR